MINVGDFVGEKEVTKVTKEFVFFEKEKLSKKKIDSNKIIKKYLESCEIDWSNRDIVLSCFRSFKRYFKYVTVGCKFETACVYISDGICHYNGKNYMGYKGISEKHIPADGWYYVRLYEQIFSNYLNPKDTNVYYVYITENQKPYTKKEIDEIEFRNNYKFGNLQKDIEHINKLDLSRVNSNELNFIKTHQNSLYEKFLPYESKNGIRFYEFMKTYNPISCQRGMIYIDNSCNSDGILSKMKYSVQLYFHPSYSKECKYYRSLPIKSINQNDLEKMSVLIQQSLKQYSSEL